MDKEKQIENQEELSEEEYNKYDGYISKLQNKKYIEEHKEELEELRKTEEIKAKLKTKLITKQKRNELIFTFFLFLGISLSTYLVTINTPDALLKKANSLFIFITVMFGVAILLGVHKDKSKKLKEEK